MRFTVYTHELKVGGTYTYRNNYHHEYEYGEVKYVGTMTDEYGDTLYMFEDGPMPGAIVIVLDKSDIDNGGMICR